MKASKGMKSVESYREAVKYQEEVNKNYLQIARSKPDIIRATAAGSII